MAICVRTLFTGALMALVFLAGCSPSGNSAEPDASVANDIADGIASVTGAANNDADDTDSAMLAADNPCRLLTTAEVRGVIPGAKAGVRETSLEQYGISACIWKTPTSKFVLQSWTGEEDTVDVEARGLAAGFTDPLSNSAEANVRFENITGVGESARAMVEVKSDEKGILGDVAMLISQRGTQFLVLESSDLAHGDRNAALKALTKLAKLADARM